MRLLVVEDNRALARLLVQGLGEEGWEAQCTHDGEDGLRRLSAANPPFDAMILDWMLPRRDGLEVLRILRQRGDDIPVLLLTAKGELEDRVQGLDGGADDYLAKPFELDELFARIRALVRRARGQASNRLHFGSLVVDPLARRVLVEDVEVDLSAREWAVLDCLLQHRGRVLSREQILEHVYPDGVEAESNIVDVYIGHLRKKLGHPKSALRITTRRGLGYELEATR